MPGPAPPAPSRRRGRPAAGASASATAASRSAGVPAATQRVEALAVDVARQLGRDGDASRSPASRYAPPPTASSAERGPCTGRCAATRARSCPARRARSAPARRARADAGPGYEQQVRQQRARLQARDRSGTGRPSTARRSCRTGRAWSIADVTLRPPQAPGQQHSTLLSRWRDGRLGGSVRPIRPKEASHGHPDPRPGAARGIRRPLVSELGASLNAALVMHRRPARPVPRHGRRRGVTPGGARRPHGHARALRARVAQRPGGGRLRDLRPRHRALHAAARAGLRAAQEDSPVDLRRRLPARQRHRARRGPHRRGLPERRAASAGTSITTASSRAPSASSGRATTRTW